jgi:hypothetical protein
MNKDDLTKQLSGGSANTPPTTQNSLSTISNQLFSINQIISNSIQNNNAAGSITSLYPAAVSTIKIESDQPNNNLGVRFHGGNSKRNTNGTSAYNYLTTLSSLGGRSWIITDGGPE